jgi:hypothetical protein|tara:strand:+ start:207 stop:1544 length:1338 start_codon:yes stop_codon:yes gene_type:complete
MASTHLSQTISSSTGKKFTMSTWIKKSANDNINQIFHLTSDNNTHNYIDYATKSGYGVDFQLKNGSSGTYLRRRVTRLFRDFSGWYHLVIRFDSTQASAGDRLRIYINGEQATDIDVDGTPDVPQDYVTDFNTNGSSLLIGKNPSGGGYYFDGLMSHFHLCDGYSYAPTEFGETDSTTGIWKFKTQVSVSYGTNGFFIFKDSNNLSGSTVQDQSGQGNNFTVSGTLTSLKDCPDNVFATLNSLGGLNGDAKGTYSNTNTTWVSSTTDQDACNSTLAVNGGGGKYYCEVKCVSKTGGYYNPGVFSVVSSAYNSSNPSVFVRGDGVVYNNGSQTQSGLTALADGDIVGMAYDASNATHTIQFYRNGSTYGSAENISNSPGYSLFFGDGTNSGSVSNTVSFNFGNGYFGTTAVSSAQNPSDGIGIFEYSVPSGFKALCTKSINAQEYN